MQAKERGNINTHTHYREGYTMGKVGSTFKREKRISKTNERKKKRAFTFCLI
jgi:hypothetical protein